MSITTEPTNQDEAVLLRVHLRGGQTVEMTVTDWKIRTDLGGGMVEFRWTSVPGGELVPWLNIDAIDAITRHEIPAP